MTAVCTCTDSLTPVSGVDHSSPDIPLVHLIRESDGFTDMETTPSEADAVRAVQTYLSNVLEARILVSSPQKSVWHSPGPRSDVTGGYEIRRKDWQSLRSVTTPLRKSDWDVRTVYLVRIKLRIKRFPAPMNPLVNDMLTAFRHSRINCQHVRALWQQSIVLFGHCSTAETIVPSMRSNISGLFHPWTLKPSSHPHSRALRL
jgi:hypothetical protein